MLTTLNERPISSAIMPILQPLAPQSVAPTIARLTTSAHVSGTDHIPAAVPVTPIRGGLAPKARRRVCDYVDAHLDGNMSIILLSSIAGLSPFHFARAFKKSVGVTPHDYVIQRRVERARELLVGSDMPLSEIALAAGFADQSHCARRFREYIGMCPRDYRWSMR